jgi:hypothetical protein
MDEKLMEFGLKIYHILYQNYYSKMITKIVEDKMELNTTLSLILNPDKIVMCIGNSHISIEYFRSLKPTTELCEFNKNMDLIVYDFRNKKNFLESVLGIKFNDNERACIKLPWHNVNMKALTAEGFAKAIDWHYDIFTNSEDVIFGANFLLEDLQFTRIINSVFIDSLNDNLITRRINWIDFIPVVGNNLEYTGLNSLMIQPGYYNSLYKDDVLYKYPLPKNGVNSKIDILNKFIELVANKKTTEPKITKFLEDDNHKFILLISFFANNAYSQLGCE